MMNISWTSCFGRALWFFALAFSLVGAGPLHAPVALRNPLQDKNFFLLSAIERTPAVRALVQSDAALAQIGAAKRAALSESPRVCAADVPCYAKALRWTDDEIAQSRAALGELGRDAAVSRFVQDVLRQSGVFQRYSMEPASALLESAWEDAARKMNRAIDVFALAQPPRFPGMDLTAYDVKSPAFGRMVQIMAAVVGSDPKSLELFFEPSLRFAVELLLLHGRDEAARHEPLETGENRAAVARIPSINWAQFPYTVIVVLGSGPERDGVALAPVGRLRLILAVRDYREKKAPFILVSGGYVHPNLTPYSEAMEMKKALRTEFGIPENAILVDPHARRTTTNLRNAARLMYRYGIPFERKGLILTDQLHSASIEASGFRERCVRDFGYEPVRLLSRTSPFDLEFVPLIDSLHADASDLLDP
jgi:hypothetical protein